MRYRARANADITLHAAHLAAQVAVDLLLQLCAAAGRELACGRDVARQEGHVPEVRGRHDLRVAGGGPHATLRIVRRHPRQERVQVLRSVAEKISAQSAHEICHALLFERGGRSTETPVQALETDCTQMAVC